MYNYYIYIYGYYILQYIAIWIFRQFHKYNWYIPIEMEARWCLFGLDGDVFAVSHRTSNREFRAMSPHRGSLGKVHRNADFLNNVVRTWTIATYHGGIFFCFSCRHWTRRWNCTMKLVIRLFARRLNYHAPAPSVRADLRNHLSSISNMFLLMGLYIIYLVYCLCIFYQNF